MRCAFPACDHDSSQNTSPKVTFHRLPDEESLRAAWMEALGQTDWTPEPGSVVCSEHILVMDLLGTSTEHPLQIITKDLIISGLQNYDAISSDPADNSIEVDIEGLDDVNKQTDARVDESPEDVKFTVDQNYIYGEDETIYVAKDEFKTENEDLNVINLDVYDSIKENSDIVNLTVKLENSARLDKSPEDVKFTDDQNYIFGEDGTIHVTKDKLKTENEGLNFIEESHLEDVVCDSNKENSDIVNLTVKLENSEVIHKENPSDEQSASHISSTGKDVLDDLTQMEGLGAKTMEKTRRVVNEVEVDEQQTPEADGPSTDDMLRCDICHYQTDSDIQLLEHLKAHAASNNVRQKRNLQTHQLKHSREKSYTCDVCKKVFRLKVILKNHLLLHFKTYSCDVCNKMFSRRDGLKKHILMHSNEKPYSCDVCNKMFRRKGHLQSHQITHSNVKPYSCDVCKKKFTVKSNLMRHQLIHSNIKPYSCDVCNKMFREKSKLIRHQLIHSNVKTYSCDVCNKMFTLKGYLSNHQVIHSNVKPYSCNVCNKMFGLKHQLQSHQITHSNVKPYSCDVCNKMFSRRGVLIRHQLIHSNDKPYSCDVCNKMFRQKSTLITHQLIHSNVKLYSCDVCNKEFRHKGPLKKHLLMHSKEKP